MKKHLLRTFFSIPLFISVLAVHGQKLKYKDVYETIKSGDQAKALTELRIFLSTETHHINGNYWAGKLYYDKATKQQSAMLADSSIYFFKVANDRVSELDVNPLNSSKFPDFTGVDPTEKVNNGKKYITKKIEELEFNKAAWKDFEEKEQVFKEKIRQDSINKISEQKDKAKRESANNSSRAKSDSLEKELEKNQKTWAAQNTGVNDPMVVANKYIELWKSGNIEELLKLGIEEGSYNGGLKMKQVEHYKTLSPADKLKMKETFKQDNIKSNFRQASAFKKDAKFCVSASVTTRVTYYTPTDVMINDAAIEDYLDKSYNCTSVNKWMMKLKKVNGKWMVSYFRR